MLLRLLFQDELLRIAYDEREDWLYIDWLGDHTPTTVMAGCELLLEYVQHTRCRRVLNDNRQLHCMWGAAARWCGEEFMPRLAEAGVQQLAWIYAPDSYGRVSTDLTLYYTTSLSAKAFEAYDAAAAWLRVN